MSAGEKMQWPDSLEKAFLASSSVDHIRCAVASLECLNLSDGSDQASVKKAVEELKGIAVYFAEAQHNISAAGFADAKRYLAVLYEPSLIVRGAVDRFCALPLDALASSLPRIAFLANYLLTVRGSIDSLGAELDAECRLRKPESQSQSSEELEDGDARKPSQLARDTAVRQTDGPAPRMQFLFNGVSVSFEGAPLRYRLCEALWDPRKGEPHPERDVSAVVKEVWGDTPHEPELTLKNLSHQVNRCFDENALNLRVKMSGGKVWMEETPR
jgi:hypothetical protein